MTVPPAAVSAYETLRGEVLRGHARPDGLGAIVYHGLVHGLSLLSRTISESATPVTAIPALPDVRADREFLHLLANMVLRTHAGVTHVY